MRLLRRIAGFLGFVKDEGAHEVKDQESVEDDHHRNNHRHDQQSRFPSNYEETGLPRKGFGVPVKVAVDRAQLGPVLVPSSSGDGGVQVCLSHSLSLNFICW